MLLDAERVGGCSKCSGCPIFIFFFIKENWICTIIKHHDGSNNILLTRNLPTDSGVRQ